MSKRTPSCERYPKWTEARFWSFIRSALRQAWNKWPPKYELLGEARRPVKGKGNQKWEYKCSECNNHFKAKEVEVDHIEPAGSLKSFDDLPGFCSRLFVGASELRVVCKECHKRITAEQSDRRKSL